MSAAIEVLQVELEDQKEKLKVIRNNNSADIERGRRAQSELDAQSRHVNEIQNAINHLKSVGRSHQIPVAA